MAVSFPRWQPPSVHLVAVCMHRGASLCIVLVERIALSVPLHQHWLCSLTTRLLGAKSKKYPLPFQEDGSNLYVFYVHGTVHPYNIVQVNNQRDAAFVLFGLLSLYMFRIRFVSIFRSNTQNCKGSHQCVSLRVGWSGPIPSGMCMLSLGTMWLGCPWG